MLRAKSRRIFRARYVSVSFRRSALAQKFHVDVCLISARCCHTATRSNALI